MCWWTAVSSCRPTSSRNPLAMMAVCPGGFRELLFLARTGTEITIGIQFEREMPGPRYSVPEQLDQCAKRQHPDMESVLIGECWRRFGG